MSQSFSYPLRPGKFVDRALFVDLLQHIDRSVPIRDAIYFGFGGPCMEDHRVIHSALGLRKLISIEKDPNIFAQQKFNRPLREIICVNKEAKDFIDEFDAEIRRIKISPLARRIIWFDYEAPDEIMQQLQALQALIDLSNDGDVLRITVNAHATTLGNRREDESESALKARRMDKLRNRLGDFAPENLTAASTEHAGYPLALLEAIKVSALRATSESGRTFLPLLIVQYADGQTMLTVTGIILGDDEVKNFLSKTGLKKWTYYADEWQSLEKLSSAPSLTLRERMHMDQAVMGSANKLPARLSYLTKLQRSKSSDLAGIYRRYQRFLPRFQHVDI